MSDNRVRTTVPAVLDYLYKQLKPLFSDVTVTDGMPTVGEAQAHNILCIGFSGIPGEPAISTNTRTREQLATNPDRESYEITCIASSWQGNNTNTQKVRNKVFEIIDRLNEYLVEDSQLGLLVMRARLNDDQYAQEQTTKGAVVTVRFSISIDAMTRR